MIIVIDQASEHPIYLQIRDQVVAGIARGELRPADGLPSVRALAADLGVNLHTVNKAYAVLRDEGYVLMRGRSGAFVADYAAAAAPERVAAADGRLAGQLRQLALEHKARGGTQGAFMDVVSQQVEAVYADPGTAGARRDVRVLGVDPEGGRLAPRGGDGASAVGVPCGASAAGTVLGTKPAASSV